MATVTTKSTSKLEVMAPTNTAELLKKFEGEIKKLERIDSAPWKTSGKIPGFSTNLKEETSIPQLIKMYSSVKGRENAYNEAAEDLGSTTYPTFDFRENGDKTGEGNAISVKEDVQLRIDILEQKGKLDQLKALRDEAKTFLTKEEQKEEFYNRVNAVFGS